MTQPEFLEMIEEKLKNRETSLYEGERSEALKHINDINCIVKKHYLNYFRRELMNQDCQHYSDAGYEDWYSYFDDTDGENYGMWLRELMTEEQCDDIWNSTHIDNPYSDCKDCKYKTNFDDGSIACECDYLYDENGDIIESHDEEISTYMHRGKCKYKVSE